MKKITEEEGIHEEWYKEARDMTWEKFPEFFNRLQNDYEHDYGTVCHAVAAAGIAAMWAMNEKQGITGFQAGCIQWEVIRRWSDKEGPMRLVEYENMLYPQYKEKFEKVITEETWKYLQKEAQKKMDEKSMDDLVSETVVSHWQSIIDGVVPFGYLIIKGKD